MLTNAFVRPVAANALFLLLRIICRAAATIKEATIKGE
jgi:hypothetical protein